MHTRSRFSLPTALLTSLTLIVAFAGGAAAAETRLSTQLTGGATEVPPGDPDGSGSATITIDPQAGTLCYEITVQNIQPATASHIHVAPPGEAGPVVVPLDVDGFEGSTEGCIEPMEDAQALQDIVDDPAAHYVNIHTADFPGGAVRGQLGQAPAPNTATTPAPAATVLVTLLGALALLSAIAVVFARRPSVG